MRTAQIKKQLHKYIDNAGDKKLKAIYTILQHDLEETSMLSDEQTLELDNRLTNYMNGQSKTYSWDETIST